MDAVDFQFPPGNDHRLLELHPERQLDLRPTPRDRQARSGHEWKPELPGRGHHVESLGAIVRQVLVVEYRHGLAGSAKHVNDLLEEFEPRVELLALRVVPVVAVLRDDEDTVHGQLPRAERQGLGDGRAVADAVVLRDPLAQVLRPNLIDEEGREFGVREVIPVRGQVSAQESPANVVGMGQVVIGRGNERQFAFRGCRPSRGVS
jgi:hypothetical protein